jgi:hypothetical protein
MKPAAPVMRILGIFVEGKYLAGQCIDWDLRS